MGENTESTDKPKKGSSYRYYPGRSEKDEFPWWQKMWNETYDSQYSRMVCEKNVMRAFQKNPILKILRGALENAGCPVTLNRHLACEDCSQKVQGGFDAEFNQIVLCKNVRKVRDQPEAALIHELIHMYDYCVNEVNFSNLEHLACTEIRAANIAHCSFLSSFFMGQSSPFNIKKTHQYCVKMKAAQSLIVARNLDLPTALKYVFKVFDRCYNDLEPVGRRIRRNSEEPLMAKEEARCFLISE